MRDLMKLGCVALVLSLSLVARAAAGPFEDGVAAYGRSDFATALRLWRPLADQGDPRAQRQLGYMYSHGYGVPQDYAEAVKWWSKAAAQGLAEAQIVLGDAYHHGEGVPRQDDKEAAKWFRRAADQGYVPAQLILGHVYERGDGVPQDYVQAHMWFNLASAHAQRGEDAYRNGAIISRDRVATKMTPAQIAEA